MNDGDFDETVLRSDRPVLGRLLGGVVRALRALAPAVDAVARSWGDRARVVKLDVDASQEITGRYGVLAIPTLILFKDGAEVERLLEAVTTNEIARKLERHIGDSVNQSMNWRDGEWT